MNGPSDSDHLRGNFCLKICLRLEYIGELPRINEIQELMPNAVTAAGKKNPAAIIADLVGKRRCGESLDLMDAMNGKSAPCSRTAWAIQIQ